jgi:hypothetical protein
MAPTSSEQEVSARGKSPRDEASPGQTVDG